MAYCCTERGFRLHVIITQFQTPRRGSSHIFLYEKEAETAGDEGISDRPRPFVPVRNRANLLYCDQSFDIKMLTSDQAFLKTTNRVTLHPLNL